MRDEGLRDVRSSYFILPTSYFAPALAPQFTVTTYAQVFRLPAASPAVQVMVVAPAGRVVGASLARLVTAQLSVAVAELSWADGKPQGLPLPATVAAGGQVTKGFSLSVTVTVKEQVVLLAELSMARQITVLVPVGNIEPLARPLNRLRLPPVQLSEYVGVV
jgi:hypothetical protein